MTTWVLVANRNSARILNRHDGYLEDVERLACTKPSPPDPELASVTTHPASEGRSDELADESAAVRRQTAASTFALRLAAHLERARQRSSFERLVLIAEPGFLELLRMWLSKHVLELVVASIATDSEMTQDFTPLASATSA
ncbi:MAG TPA: host attachment protein [Polyangiaceae bacterium]|nr:host attachment protein [Polyangiaceae bacterium]